MRCLRNAGIIVLLVSIIFSFAGCRSNFRNQKDAENDGAQEAENVKQLSFLMPQTSYNNILKDVYDKFQHNYSNIKINNQLIPDNQFLDFIKVKLVTGETPDILFTHSANIKQLNATLNFVNFSSDEPWVSRAIPQYYDLTKIDGKSYGPPLCTTGFGMGIVYVNDLFVKYNVKVPKTYDELITACETFKKNGVIPIYACGKDIWTVQIWFAASAPTAVMNKPGIWNKLLSNDLKWADVPEFQEILQKQLDIFKKGYVNEDFITATYDSAHKKLADQEAAMIIMNDGEPNEIAKINPNLNIRMTPIVGTDSDTLAVGASVALLSIFSQSKNQDESKKFIRFFTQRDKLNFISEAYGWIPPYKDMAVELKPWQKELYDYYLLTGKTCPEMNNRLPVGTIDLWTYEQEMLIGNKTPKQVLEAWDVKFAELMKAKAIPGW